LLRTVWRRPLSRSARALNAITPEALLSHVKVVSYDEFDGRAPATPGEQQSLDCIIGDAGFPLTAQDCRVTSSQPKAAITVPDSPIVFAGYGIVTPEYKWDDYEDVKGNAVALLPGDPPISNPADPTKLDPKIFLAAKLSFHGRLRSPYKPAARAGLLPRGDMRTVEIRHDRAVPKNLESPMTTG
jgi:hypothetical protein